MSAVDEQSTINSMQARKCRFGNAEVCGRLRSLEDSTRLTVDSLSDTSDRKCWAWKSAASQLTSIVESTEESAKVHLYVQQYGCTPPPIFVVTISLLQVGIFIFYSTTNKVEISWLSTCNGCILQQNRESLMIFDSAYANQLWRFCSYFLIHQGLEHILFNLCVQIFLGIPLEIVHKIWRIGPLYIVGTIFGAVLHFIADKEVTLVGGSGGSYAILGAYTANLATSASKVMKEKMKLAAIILSVIVDIGHAAYRRYFLNLCQRKSYVAHLGGFLAGLMLHAIAFHQFSHPEYPKMVRCVLPGCFVVLLIVLTISGSIIGISDVPSLLYFCNVTYPNF